MSLSCCALFGADPLALGYPTGVAPLYVRRARIAQRKDKASYTRKVAASRRAANLEAPQVLSQRTCAEPYQVAPAPHTQTHHRHVYRTAEAPRLGRAVRTRFPARPSRAASMSIGGPVSIAGGAIGGGATCSLPPPPPALSSPPLSSSPRPPPRRRRNISCRTSGTLGLCVSTLSTLCWLTSARRPKGGLNLKVARGPRKPQGRTRRSQELAVCHRRGRGQSEASQRSVLRPTPQPLMVAMVISRVPTERLR